MLDQSLLQSHFIGRDGFRWWIGQIAPIAVQEDQQNYNGGWGRRYKVRILGYHPLDNKSLTDEDLPWAQVMLPTTAGTGAANYAVNPKLSQGDIVIGFYLDGDNSQIPVIMGALGRTDQYSNGEYKNPFIPFTGYTSNIPTPNGTGRNYANQTNEATPTSQLSPRQVPPEVAKRLGELYSYSGIGKEVVFADTCEDTTIKTIKNEVSNLLKSVEEGKGKIEEYRQAIANTAEVIKSSLNWLVGAIMDSIYNFLVGTEEKPGIIPKTLKAIYETVYASVFAATGSPAAAHTAGYKSNEVFVIPIKVLEQALSCVANAIVEGLKDLIVDLLTSVIENVKQFASCAVEQFVGVLLTSIVDAVADGLSAALDGVSALLGAFDVVDFITGTIDAIKSLGGLFDCNQTNTKCDGVKEWVIGSGPKKQTDIEKAFNGIFDVLNNANAVIETIQNAQGTVQGIAGQAKNLADIFIDGSLLSDAVNALSQCYTGLPTSCGPAQINIFGGGGLGATAVPIFGTAIENSGIIQSGNQVAGVIGAIITNSGSGYRFPPFVEITDNCGLGYGAKGRAVINSNGEVTSIYITSSGEGYPISEQYNTQPYGVVDVTVQSSGTGYSASDTASDNFGNTYSLTVDNGFIISAQPINTTEISTLPVITVNSTTGSGAILKPVIGLLSELKTEVTSQVDCIV